MSSRIRNTLNVGVAALIVGAAAITLAPTPALAFELGGTGGLGGLGGFGHEGGVGHMGNSGHMGSRGLGNSGHSTTGKVGSGKTASDKGKAPSDKATSDKGKTASDKAASDKTPSDKPSSDSVASDTGGYDRASGDFYMHIYGLLDDPFLYFMNSRAHREFLPGGDYLTGYIPANTGDPGWFVWAYTAQFGGGFSAILATEARRMAQIIDDNATVPVPPSDIVSGPIVPVLLSDVVSGPIGPVLLSDILSGPIVPVLQSDIFSGPIIFSRPMVAEQLTLPKVETEPDRSNFRPTEQVE